MIPKKGAAGVPDKIVLKDMLKTVIRFGRIGSRRNAF
jgi:hypothetical protein